MMTEYGKPWGTSSRQRTWDWKKTSASKKQRVSTGGTNQPACSNQILQF